MIFLEYVGSRASLSANKLKFSALRWAFFRTRPSGGSGKHLRGRHNPTARTKQNASEVAASPPDGCRNLVHTLYDYDNGYLAINCRHNPENVKNHR